MISSSTMFVVASSNVMAVLAEERPAIATAAYEQDEDAAPSPVARARVLGLASGSSFAISRLETTAWMTADRAKPRKWLQDLAAHGDNPERLADALEHGANSAGHCAGELPRS